MSMKWIVGAVALCVALAGVAAVEEPCIRPRWSGAEVGEWTMDYNAAFEAAATNASCRGVVMYYVGLWWCPYCQAVEKYVLTNSVWLDYVQSNNLYLVAMDFPGRTGNNWCWLWDADYIAEAGLTAQDAGQEILNRYAVQTKYAVPGATYNAAFDYLQIGYPTMVVVRPDDRDRTLGRTSFPDFRTGYTDATATAVVLRQFNQILEADPEDEDDNYWQGATLLDVSEECEDDLVAFGSRTLSERDTADWYAFESTRNKAWTFAVTPGERGATNRVAVAIYAVPTGSSVASQTLTLAEDTGITYTTPSDGLYYLRVSRPSGSASVLQGYHLAYGYSKLASVSFAQTEISAANAAGSVALKVNIVGAELSDEVVVSYETGDITAVAGADYTAASGTLAWAVGEKKDAKTITVTTLRPAVWEADKTFRVTLSAERNCAVTEISTCVVTLKAAARKPGKLAFAAGTPKTATLTEGLPGMFTLARTGGADGVVTARVDVVAQGGAPTLVTNVVWTSGDDAPQAFEFAFPEEAGYQPDQTATLALTALGGAAAGSPLSVGLMRRDNLLAQTFAEYAAAHKAWGLKTTGAWFQGYLAEGDTEAWLRTAPQAAGAAAATLSGTWAGPGALTFACQREAGAEMTLLVNGAAVTTDFVDGELCWVALPAGKQTVTWQVAGPEGAFGAVAVLAFVPLPQAAPLAPLNQSLVAAGPVVSDFFRWAGADMPAPFAPTYQVYFGTKAAALAAPLGTGAEDAVAATSYPWPYAESHLSWLSGYVADAVGKTLYWRVDTVIQDAYGRYAVTHGSVSSVGILGADAPTVDTGALPADCAVDGATVGLPPLTVGVQSRVGPFPLANVAAGAAASVTVRSGKLPAGVTAQVADGAVWLTGVPKTSDAGKAGAADLALSVRPAAGGKAAQGTSLRVGWNVVPLGRAAGQFNGFLTVDDEPGYGDIKVTVSASGKVSGTFRHEGVKHTFTAPNFDLIDAGGQFMVTNATAKAAKKITRRVSLAIGTAQAPEAALTVHDGMGCVCEFMMYRNNWAEAAPMGPGDALANYVGYYTAALPVEAHEPSVAPVGTGYLTLTVGAKGTVKYAGALADGKGVSGSAVLLYGPDCCSSTDRLMFSLLAIPRGYGAGSGLYGLIQLVPDDNHAVTDVTLAPAHTYLTWVNTDPKSVYGHDVVNGISYRNNIETGTLPGGGSSVRHVQLVFIPEERPTEPMIGIPEETILGFTNILNVVGGHYVKKTSLLQHYSVGTTLAFEQRFCVPFWFNGAEFNINTIYDLISLPVVTNLPMTVTAAAKLAAPAQSLVKNDGLVDCDASANPWGMAFTFTPATGLFKASFKAYYQQDANDKVRQKTKTFSAKGVFVPKRASYDDPADWYGFYLIPDTCGLDMYKKGYPFKWSYDVRLGVAPAP